MVTVVPAENKCIKKDTSKRKCISVARWKPHKNTYGYENAQVWMGSEFHDFSDLCLIK